MRAYRSSNAFGVFHLMAEPFTIENGLMTPTLKLKRQRIYNLHGDLIAGLYGR